MRLRDLGASCSILFALAASACGAPDAQSEAEAPEARADEAHSRASHVVEVVARDFAFEAPSELRPGWTTFRLTNEGAQEHFMALTRLPEGKTLEDYAAEVGPAFDLTPYTSGEMDKSTYLGHVAGLIPEWYFSVVNSGGPGFISPGAVSETTLLLEPGTYVAECYVKTPDGRFHVELGMVHEITVAGEPTDAVPPEYDIEIALTNYEINWEGTLSSGEHTARIRYVDDPEGLFKHDVHLVRLGDDGSIGELVPWMDWIDGLHAPAPARFEGGSEHHPAGSTAYLKFELEPGTYAWISEGYAAQGMVVTFAVE
jgi:hypothetical protein